MPDHRARRQGEGGVSWRRCWFAKTDRPAWLSQDEPERMRIYADLMTELDTGIEKAGRGGRGKLYRDRTMREDEE
jgi:hypothetical protein